MLKRVATIAAGWLALTGMQAPMTPQPQIQLWRLDCGEFVIKQYGAFFSDTFQYPPGPKDIVGSCYLIRHGNRYMLWDTGLTDALIGNDFDNPAQTLRLKRSLVDQLKQIEASSPSRSRRSGSATGISTIPARPAASRRRGC